MVWVVSLLTVKLSPHGLTLRLSPDTTRVFVECQDGWRAATHRRSAPATAHHDRAPRGFSMQTRYPVVRLAFHLYPQFIRSVCNLSRFGPPRSFTSASS